MILTPGRTKTFDYPVVGRLGKGEKTIQTAGMFQRDMTEVLGTA